VTSTFLAALLLSFWAMPTLALGQSFTCPALLLEHEQPGKSVSTAEAEEHKRRDFGIVMSPRFSASVMDQPFFNGLEQVRTARGTEFRKNGHVVQSYPESFVITMRPVTICQPDCIKNAVIPPELWDLHFKARWLGSGWKNLRVIESKMITEPWPELGPWRIFYRLQIPAKDVPLTDFLELHMLSKGGKEIGCMRPHL